MWRHGLFVIAGAWLSSCVGANAFPCDVTSECVDAGQLGVCQADGWCSFPDGGCPSGQRYGEHAGDGLAGLCVGDDGTTGGGGDSTPLESSSDSDPTIATLEATGPVADGGETSTGGDDASSMGATATATSSPTDGVEEGEVTSDDPTDGAQPICGNELLELGEGCDGLDFGGQSCASVVPGTAGTLACDAQCQLDASMCTPADEDDYLPCDVDDECPAAVCHLFAGNGTCLPTCMNDMNCPLLEGADADPFCSEGDFCLVPCISDDACPVGMRCDDSMYGLVCLF
jgi:hypothetical protein